MIQDITLEETSIKQLFLISTKIVTDKRGAFVKIFQRSKFSHIFGEDFSEIYYSVSGENTIRGMHYQSPPHAHIKLIYVPKGSITDVVLDLRSNSSSFGKYESFTLNETNRMALLVPAGLAHGFLAKKNNTIVCYHQTSEYNANADKGILWNSFGFNWDITNPVISERDKNFVSFAEFSEKFRNTFIQ